MSNINTKKKRCSAAAVFRGIASAIFALIGILAIGCVIYLCKEFTNSKPILTFTPDVPRERIISFMDHVCEGDHAAAEAYLLGTPSMGADKSPTDEISVLIWDAFVDSCSYELTGECYTTDDGLAQNLRFTCLDMRAVTENLRERSQTLLKQRVESAEDVSEIYDENNEYRADVVNEVLRQAVKDAIKEDAASITADFTVYLKYRDGQWWIQADQTLLDVLFGDVLFYAS